MRRSLLHYRPVRRIPKPTAAVAALALAGTALLAVGGMGATPASAAAVACSPATGFNNCVQYTYSGAAQTFRVPAGVTQVSVNLVGAGGGSPRFGSGGVGGDGGETTGRVSVAPGQTLTVTVGQGGVSGGVAAPYGGGGRGSVSSGFENGQGNVAGSSGGGMTAVWNGPEFTVGSALLIAGGGGGGVASQPVTGGDGGGAAGADGTSYQSGTSGRGGSQTAGGAGGTTTQACTVNAAAGTQFAGGAGATGPGGGGGGGGGWFGGGGSGCGRYPAPANLPTGGSGAGGGSGYIGGPGVSAASTVAGAGAAGGVGSSSGGTNGGNGTATISFTTTAPTITAPAAGSTTNGTPTITGTGAAGARVVVEFDGAPVACAEDPITVPASGLWTCTPSTPLPTGTGNLVATQSDPAAPLATYPDSAPVSLTVDATAPTAPVITSPADGAATNDATPTFMGTGEDGSTITLTDGAGNTICTTTVTNGAWSCTPTSSLPQGATTVTPTATDAVGNSTAGTPIDLTVDTTAPAVPVITAPTDGSATKDTTPTFTGTGENGSTITLTDGAGNTVCETTVTNGAWSCTPTTPLPEGATSVTPTATDAAGNTSTGDAVAVIVDTTAPTAPAITAPADGGVTNDTTPTFRGTGEDGSTVTLTDDAGNTVCEATVVGGSWSCTPTTPLPEGASTVTPTATDAAGNTTAGTPIDVTVDTVPPTAPTDVVCAVNANGTVTCAGSGTSSDTVIVRDDDGNEVCRTVVPASGNWTCTSAEPVTAFPVQIIEQDPAGNGSGAVTTPALPRITAPTAGQPTNDTTPTFTGTAGAGDTVQLRDPDGTVICETTAAADGSWSCTPTTALPEGATTLTPVAISADGTELAGAPFDLLIDTTPPTAPTDAVCAQNANGTATCSGTGNAGDTVVIRDPSGNEVCRTVIPADGAWSCTSDGPVDASTVRIVYIDPAGNESAAATVPVTPYQAGGTGTVEGNGGSGTSGDGQLAFTGADITGMTLTALALLAAGGIGLTMRRRRTNGNIE